MATKFGNWDSPLNAQKPKASPGPVVDNVGTTKAPPNPLGITGLGKK